jgi:hypothetical protein
MLFKTLDAVFQGVVDLEDIVKLQEFEQLHHLGIDITDLEKAIVIIGCLHDGKKYTETGTINEIDAFEVQNELGFGLGKIFFQLLFYRLCNERVKPVDIVKSHYNDAIDAFSL